MVGHCQAGRVNSQSVANAWWVLRRRRCCLPVDSLQTAAHTPNAHAMHACYLPPPLPSWSTGLQHPTTAHLHACAFLTPALH